MDTQLRAALERHQPHEYAYDKCHVCGQERPCDASRALAALDAAEADVAELRVEKADALRIKKQQRGMISALVEDKAAAHARAEEREAEIDRLESEVSVLVKALRGAAEDYYERHGAMGDFDTVCAYDAMLADLSAAAAQHKARVAREAVAAERERLETPLAWALDLLDMYDEEFVKVDGPQKVYSEIHVLGKQKARAALGVRQHHHEWAWGGDGTWDYCTVCYAKRDQIDRDTALLSEDPDHD
jgi:hypothetical protein